MIGQTVRGRRWTGSVETGLPPVVREGMTPTPESPSLRAAVIVLVVVDGIPRTATIGWPLQREPTEREYQGWADGLEARHERETSHPTQRGEIPGRPGGRGGRRAARRRP